MPNRLARETSPYLLQHANNPVDWYPWGPEAFAEARRRDVPIFLSIGYSACHWCHVMEHESFEQPQIAAAMNEHFVNIKVDREERTDLDQIYMTAVQMLTGRGGWPMSVFLDHELRPFYGGTYWPAVARYGMLSFPEVLAGIARVWRDERDTVREQSQSLADHLRRVARPVLPARTLSDEPLAAAAETLARQFDRRHGGFGGAPKFPHPMDLQVVLRLARLRGRADLEPILTLTLDKMAAGGIYDHLGGGFHRYSVDERWLVPHFEKMLYDNALLAACYVEAWQATGREDYRRVARETLDYVLREMTLPEGGFASTQDADSEGEEGKFYVWSPRQVAEVLGTERAELFCRAYDVTEAGNFEGHSILNRPRPLAELAAAAGLAEEELRRRLDEDRRQLYAARARRVWPGLDDKALVSWNALMIGAFALAATAFGDDGYRQAATRAADFLLTRLRRPDGRLLHAYRQGQARFDAYLDDYAALVGALVAVYEATFDERWIDAAVALADVLLARFFDPAQGGFFYTADDHEQLLLRQKDFQDSSVPSGNALTATALIRLGKLTGRGDYLSAAERTLAIAMDLMRQHPTATGQMLVALDLFLGPTQELVFTGPGGEEGVDGLVGRLGAAFRPRKLVARRPAEGHSAALAGLFAGKDLAAREPTLYVCEQFACQAPVVGEAAIRAALGL